METHDLVLVTGAAGFVGVKVVSWLLDMGFTRVRCFVRPSSRLERLREVLDLHEEKGEIELVSGDLTSQSDCRRAAEGVAGVFHLAAGIDKSFAGAFMNSALTTRNLLDALLELGCLKRFVNVSSFAVYSNFGLRPGTVFDENCPLETAPAERHDAYGYGKLKQDEIIRDYGERHGISYVIIRPGAVFGPGKLSLSGRVGIDTFGPFIQVGGRNVVPLTYVDNCAEAIVLAGVTPGVDGEVFNVVDDELPSARRFLKAYKSRVRPFVSLTIPYRAAYAICTLWEAYSRWSKGQLPAAFNRRRCSAEWKRHQYSNDRLRKRLGWSPRVGMEEALAAFFDFAAAIDPAP